MFWIDVSNMYWITEGDAPNDLCAHGDMVAKIGEETFSFNGTVSATALYLLKTLTENHSFGEDIQMMPCCGHFYVPYQDLECVHIFGCDSGIDWEVFHIDGKVRIRTETGNEVFVELEEYKKTVFQFVDKVENFYRSSEKKKVPNGEFERNGYLIFWKEWNRRRYSDSESQQNIKKNAKKVYRISRGIMWIAFVVGILIMTFGVGLKNEPLTLGLMITGIVIFSLGALQAFIWYRCPYCGYSLLNVRGAIPEHCPKCGESL